MLEPPRRGGSNLCPQCMFWGKNKKIGIPLHTPVLLYKYGDIRGYTLHGHVFMMFISNISRLLKHLPVVMTRDDSP